MPPRKARKPKTKQENNSEETHILIGGLISVIGLLATIGVQFLMARMKLDPSKIIHPRVRQQGGVEKRLRSTRKTKPKKEITNE